MIKNKWMLLLYVFAFIGVFYSSIFIHEITHVIDAEKPIAICYNFGSLEGGTVLTNYIEGKKVSEVKAYTMTTIFILLFIVLISITCFKFMEKMKK